MASGLKLGRFVGGFVCGVGLSTGACITALRLYLTKQQLQHEETQTESAVQSLIKLYGLPLTGAETRSYSNHILSYDQSRKIPRWVAEHLSNNKLVGGADRKHCKFKPDPNIPQCFTAHNEDYLGSGWSRGHMAPAGDNKFSEQSMEESFYLSNIVPQNYENNAGFWNRLEMYCRELTERFSDVWVISGPLTLPHVGEDGKKAVSYQMSSNACQQRRGNRELLFWRYLFFIGQRGYACLVSHDPVFLLELLSSPMCSALMGTDREARRSTQLRLQLLPRTQGSAPNPPAIHHQRGEGLINHRPGSSRF